MYKVIPRDNKNIFHPFCSNIIIQMWSHIVYCYTQKRFIVGLCAPSVAIPTVGRIIFGHLLCNACRCRYIRPARIGGLTPEPA